MAVNEFTIKLLRELSQLRENGDGYIAESLLAQRLAIGRPQLREILARINVFGMIEKKQKYGIRLRPVDALSRRVIFDLREMLEEYLTMHLNGKLTESDFAELEFHAQMNEQGFRSRDGAMMAEHDFKFHQILIKRAALPIVSDIMEQFSLLEVIFFTDKARCAEPCLRNPYTHHDIVAALRRSGREGARLLRKHIHWISTFLAQQQ